MNLISRPLRAALRGATVALALTLACALPVLAEFPDHPIKIVVPYPPGGTTDLLARDRAPSGRAAAPDGDRREPGRRRWGDRRASGCQIGR